MKSNKNNGNVAEHGFVVDGMLGSLARKLRIFGYDAEYYNDAEDDRLVDIALKDGRTLLTCDRSLFQRAVKIGARSILLAGENDLDDITRLLSRMRVAGVEFIPARSRCPLCNGALEGAGKDSVRNLVPDGVLERHSKFYLCGKCSKVYWEGTHLKRMTEFGRRVNRRLSGAG